MPLRVSLILHPYSSIIVVGSPLGPGICHYQAYPLLDMVSGVFSSWEAGLKSDQKVDGDSHAVCATIVQRGTSCRASHYYSLKRPQERVIDNYSPLQ